MRAFRRAISASMATFVDSRLSFFVSRSFCDVSKASSRSSNAPIAAVVGGDVSFG